MHRSCQVCKGPGYQLRKLPRYLRIIRIMRGSRVSPAQHHSCKLGRHRPL
nr:MAG TPA: hypothetical protein [Caudoviricetes sp.]